MDLPGRNAGLMGGEISLGEFEALVAKAFRGAGYPWGLANDAAFACRRLEATGLPASETALRLLQEIDGHAMADVMPDQDLQSATDMLCPICTGAAASDLGANMFATAERRTINDVVEPLFLVALLGLSPIVRDGRSLIVEWSGGMAEVTTRGLLQHGVIPAGVMSVHVTRIEDTGTPMAATITRAVLDEDTRVALSSYAARTYAPATEQSRQGAGAGLTDNN